MNSNEFTRHSDLWFDDGSVVLVAEGTGFRVHRGLLARHSGIFHDTFSLPQPVDVETFENCQVVRLMEDSAADWATVLGILYDYGKKFFNEGHQIEFRVVAAALELGTKYAFDAMRGEALRRLSHCCPRDLEEVSDIDKAHCSHWGHSVEAGCSIIWREDGADFTLVFRLARQLGLDDLIPMALYYCIQDTLLSEILSALFAKQGRFSILSMPELVACIQAHEYLSIQQAAIYETFVADIRVPSPHCTTKDLYKTLKSPCQEAMQSCAYEALAQQTFRRRDIFIPMASWIEEMGNFCEPCSLYYKEIIFKQQKEAWAYLRARFGSSSAVAPYRHNHARRTWTYKT